MTTINILITVGDDSIFFVVMFVIAWLAHQIVHNSPVLKYKSYYTKIITWLERIRWMIFGGFVYTLFV